jgi:hypothetical protein
MKKLAMIHDTHASKKSGGDQIQKKYDQTLPDTYGADPEELAGRLNDWHELYRKLDPIYNTLTLSLQSFRDLKGDAQTFCHPVEKIGVIYQAEWFYIYTITINSSRHGS